MSKPHHPSAVVVDWLDSTSRQGWNELPQQDWNLACRSVGFLVRETRDMVYVSAHVSYDDDGQVKHSHGDMAIPRASILRLRKLALPRKR